MYDKLGTKHAYGYEIWDGDTANGYSNVGTAKGNAFLQQSMRITAKQHFVSGKQHYSDFLALEGGVRNDLDFDEETLHQQGISLHDHLNLHQQQQNVRSVSVNDHEGEGQGQGTLNPPENAEGQQGHGGGGGEEKTAPSSQGVVFPPPSSSTEQQCLTTFNPTTRKAYDATLRNWSKAFLDTILLSMNASTM